MYPIPTSAQATTNGWSLPSSSGWSLPTTASTPQLTISSGFGNLIGQSAGVYPSSVQTTTQQFLSTKVPDINVVDSYVFSINLIDNKYSSPNNLIASVPLTSGLGEIVKYYPASIIYHDIYSQSYDEIVMQLFDQNLKPLQINDYAFLIHLTILSKDDLIKK